MPPVSALLLREAEAWRALLALHQDVVGTARKLASVLGKSDAVFESAREAVEVREATYYASLTQLASQCDALTEAALRLRGLRKARRGLADLQALEVLMQAHTSETLAVGSTIASNSSISAQAVAVELRQAAQATRQQIAQVRAVLQLVQERPGLQGQLSIGYRPPSADHTQTFALEDVFATVYRRSPELTVDSLALALEEMMSKQLADSSAVDGEEANDGTAADVSNSNSSSTSLARPPRSFVRRSADGRRLDDGVRVRTTTTAQEPQPATGPAD